LETCKKCSKVSLGNIQAGAIFNVFLRFALSHVRRYSSKGCERIEGRSTAETKLHGKTWALLFTAVLVPRNKILHCLLYDTDNDRQLPGMLILHSIFSYE